MALGSCYSCIKYLMFAFNFLFWLLGCAILGIGIWVRVDENFEKYTEDSEEFAMLYTGAYILIAVGVMIMVIGFLGCCGAIRENQCMLGLFFAFLFLIFAVLLGAGIWAIVAKESVQETIDDVLKAAVKKYDTDKSSKQLMDNIQLDFNCCGATKGIEDYTLTIRAEMRTSCGLNQATPCNKKVHQFFADNLLIIAGVAIGIAVILILAYFRIDRLLLQKL
ncbi:hypothetical protein ScPMuIL_015491 [Solemya velum]